MGQGCIGRRGNGRAKTHEAQVGIGLGQALAAEHGARVGWKYAGEDRDFCRAVEGLVADAFTCERRADDRVEFVGKEPGRECATFTRKAG